MTEHSDDYLAYLASDRWQLRRLEALARAEYRCQRCGVARGLEVHHLTYDRLGEELPADLKVVCEDCHVVEDRIRESSSRLKRGFNTWMRKRYGDDWAWEIDEPLEAEEWERFRDYVGVNR